VAFTVVVAVAVELADRVVIHTLQTTVVSAVLEF
jgi:hypothetical protein